MTIEIKPIDKLDFSVTIPPSKSYTNRVLILAVLASGESIIENPLKSDDTLYMVDALRQFGIKVEEEENSFHVFGSGGRIKTPEKEIYVGNAGTAMRFLTTFATLAHGKTTITGDERMRERPIGDLLSALNSLGLSAYSKRGNHCPPVEIQGGKITTDRISLRGDLSSQYLTSLLLSLPAFGNKVEIEIEGKLTSASYIDITLEIMADFGIIVERRENAAFIIKPNQYYEARRYVVQGDASSASYFFAAAAVSGGRINVRGIPPDTLQGDIRFVDLLQKMGCKVERGIDSITVTGKKLKGINADMNLMPDAVPSAAVTALFAEGKTTITNIANLRIKETDRISALSNELKKLGAEVEEGKDWISICPGTYRGATINTYNDHRMAMSFAIAGLKIPDILIENPDCVNKSFPGFFKVWKKMGENAEKNKKNPQ